MQEAGLAEEGIDAGRFASVRETESAEDAVRLVAAGEADAAFAWSSLTGDVAIGYSRGTLAALVARGEIAMDEFVIVWRSPAITHGPFAVAKSLPIDEKDRIEEYLLALERSLPGAYDALNPFYAGGYVAVEPAAYDGLELLVTSKADCVWTRSRGRPRAPAAEASPSGHAVGRRPSRRALSWSPGAGRRTCGLPVGGVAGDDVADGGRIGVIDLRHDELRIRGAQRRRHDAVHGAWPQYRPCRCPFARLHATVAVPLAVHVDGGHPHLEPLRLAFRQLQ